MNTRSPGSRLALRATRTLCALLGFALTQIIPAQSAPAQTVGAQTVGAQSAAAPSSTDRAALRFAVFLPGTLRLEAQGAEFASASLGEVGAYRLLDAGEVSLELHGEDGLLARQEAALEAGRFYTLLALQFGNTGENAGDAPQLLRLRDDLPAPEAGAAALRLVNLDGAPLGLRASPSPPDAEEGEASADPALGRLRLLLEPPGSRVVVLGPDGFVATLEGETLLSGLEPGRYIVNAARAGYAPAAAETLVAAGVESSLELRLTPLAGAAPEPDAPIVSAPGGEASPYRSVPGGRYDLALVGEDGATLAEAAGVALEPGFTYSLYLYRDPANGALALALSLDAAVWQTPAGQTPGSQAPGSRSP